MDKSNEQNREKRAAYGADDDRGPSVDSNNVEGRMAINGANAEVSEPTAPGQGTGDLATGGTRAENLGGTAGGGSHPGTGLLPEQIQQNPPE